jgi:hypothetical protein
MKDEDKTLMPNEGCGRGGTLFDPWHAALFPELQGD